jgi:hypothetical protein
MPSLISASTPYGSWEFGRGALPGIAIANRNEGLLEDFRKALPDFRPEDNVGSPYCIRRYMVDQHLGGLEGLASARMNWPSAACA